MLGLTMLAVVAAAAAADLDQYPGEANRPARCHFEMDNAGMTLTVGGGARSVAPGETARIDPRWTPYPSAWDEVPIRCLDGWRVSHPALARLSRDRRTLRIADDAPEGAVVTVSARYRGEAVTQEYRIVRPVASPLVGTWVQDATACPAGDGVFELVFGRDGTFALTFDTPMHSNVDFRGRWRTEAERLLLSDVVGRGGQALPADMAMESGFAIAEDGALRFASPWHGTAGARGRCTAAFRKAG
jgi:hypothetical protein